MYDLRTHTGLKLYDQFLNKYLPISDNRNLGFEEDVVKAYSAGKNIIYLNKPTDIEKFALALADVLPEVDSELIQTACDNISEYLQPQYNLLTCLRKGIIYHHGSVPDAIRIYIEDLYKKDEAVKYVITSSTLLSGVNLPAERMFILDNKRGSRQTVDDAKKWIAVVKQYSEPTELTAELLNNMIEKIVIHEAIKHDGGFREQKIEIYYRFVGKID